MSEIQPTPPSGETAEPWTYPRHDVDERIRTLVDNAPEFSDKQISQIRLLLHSAPLNYKEA